MEQYLLRVATGGQRPPCPPSLPLAPPGSPSVIRLGSSQWRDSLKYRVKPAPRVLDPAPPLGSSCAAPFMDHSLTNPHVHRRHRWFKFNYFGFLLALSKACADRFLPKVGELEDDVHSSPWRSYRRCRWIRSLTSSCPFEGARCQIPPFRRRGGATREREAHREPSTDPVAHGRQCSSSTAALNPYYFCSSANPRAALSRREQPGLLSVSADIEN